MHVLKHKIDKRFFFIYLFAAIMFFKQTLPYIITPAVVIVLFFLYCYIVRPSKLFNKFSIFNILFILFNLFSVINTGQNAILNTLINNLIFIFIYTSISKDLNDIKHIIISISIFAASQCIYLYWKYGELLGYGRFGEYMDDTTLSAISLSYYCIVGLISSFMLYFLYESQRIRLGALLLVSIILGIAIFSGSKKAIITPLFFIFTYLSFKQRNNIKKLLFYVVIIGSIVFIIWNYLKDIEILQKYFIGRFESFFSFISGKGYDDSTMYRMSYIPVALNCFYDNPIIGMGGLGYSTSFFLNAIGVNHPHNTYVEILAGCGLIGFILYYSVIINSLVKLFKRVKFNDTMDILLLSALLALLFNNMNSQSYNVPILNVFFFISYNYLVIIENENIYNKNKCR